MSAARPLRQELESVKRLEMSPRELVERYDHIFDFHRESARQVLRYKVPYRPLEESLVEVSRHDVRLVLEDYLASTVSLDDLRDWAYFLIMNEDYELADDAGRRVVTTVLHLVAAPELHGALTRERVQHYIECLEKNEAP